MKNLRQLILGLVIAAAALYYTLRNVSFDELLASFKTVNYLYIFPAAFFMALGYVGRAYRWRVLLLPIKRLRVSGLFSPLMVGFLGNVLPARAGEVLRAYLLGKRHQITFTGAFASIVVERLFDLIFLLLLFSWVMLFHADVLAADAGFSGISMQTIAVRFGQISAGLIGAILVFIYLMVVHKDPLLRCIQWCIRPLPKKWHDKIEFLVEEVSLGFMVAKDPVSLLKVFLYSGFIWVTIVLSFYPFYWAYDLNNKSLESVVIVTVLISVLITVLPTPAFLGSFNAGVLIGLHEIMHESEVVAVSFGMVAWAISFLVIFAGGLYFILHDHLSVQNLVEVEEQGEEFLKKKES